MHVAKVTRSGTVTSIELPAGFDLGEGDMEVVRDGDTYVLRPIAAVKNDWTWLDELEPASQQFTEHMARIEAEDTAWAHASIPQVSD